MAQPAFIACAEHSVPEKEANDLQLWLVKPEANTLRKVIESRVREQIALVANTALQAAGDAPLKINLADEHLRTARRYLDFLDILQKLRDQTTPFTVTKWQ